MDCLLSCATMVHVYNMICCYDQGTVIGHGDPVVTLNSPTTGRLPRVMDGVESTKGGDYRPFFYCLWLLSPRSRIRVATCLVVKGKSAVSIHS